MQKNKKKKIYIQNKYFIRVYIQIPILKGYSRKFECLGGYTYKKFLNKYSTYRIEY